MHAIVLVFSLFGIAVGVCVGLVYLHKKVVDKRPSYEVVSKHKVSKNYRNFTYYVYRITKNDETSERVAFRGSDDPLIRWMDTGEAISSEAASARTAWEHKRYVQEKADKAFSAFSGETGNTMVRVEEAPGEDFEIPEEWTQPPCRKLVK